MFMPSIKTRHTWKEKVPRPKKASLMRRECEEHVHRAEGNMLCQSQTDLEFHSWLHHRLVPCFLKPQNVSETELPFWENGSDKASQECPDD